MTDPEHPETRETELVHPSCRPSKAELEEPIKGTTFDDLVWAAMQLGGGALHPQTEAGALRARFSATIPL